MPARDEFPLTGSLGPSETFLMKKKCQLYRELDIRYRKKRHAESI
jgi:hypothetical protein